MAVTTLKPVARFTPGSKRSTRQVLSGLDALPPRGAFGKGEVAWGPPDTLPQPSTGREFFERGNGRREASPQPA